MSASILGTLALVRNCRQQFTEDLLMPSSTVATGTFSSRQAANQAVQRLVSSGFARNSIELHQRDDDEGYDLEVHTRKENLKRVKRLLNASAPMYSARQTASEVVQTAKSHPVILLGAGVLAGFLIYNLIPRTPETSARPRSSSGRRRR
jgi:hypothetical protein